MQVRLTPEACRRAGRTALIWAHTLEMLCSSGRSGGSAAGGGSLRDVLSSRLQIMDGVCGTSPSNGAAAGGAALNAGVGGGGTAAAGAGAGSEPGGTGGRLALFAAGCSWSAAVTSSSSTGAIGRNGLGAPGGRGGNLWPCGGRGGFGACEQSSRQRVKNWQGVWHLVRLQGRMFEAFQPLQ